MPVVRAVPITAAVPIMAARAAAVGSIPAAVAHFPSAAAMLPVRCAIDIAGARTHPDTIHPNVTPAAQLPMAGRPDMADAWRRHAFEARRWWGADMHGDGRLGERRYRYHPGAEGQQGRDSGGSNKLFHGCSLSQ